MVRRLRCRRCTGPKSNDRMHFARGASLLGIRRDRRVVVVQVQAYNTWDVPYYRIGRCGVLRCSGALGRIKNVVLSIRTRVLLI